MIGRFGGVTYDPQKEIVYVALVALGTNPGSIVSISTSDSNPSIVSTISLTQYVFQKKRIGRWHLIIIIFYW